MGLPALASRLNVAQHLAHVQRLSLGSAAHSEQASTQPDVESQHAAFSLCAALSLPVTCKHLGE